ncbi:MAG: molybdopterin molybdotransferase MoeA [Phycisphaerales bacterium]
MSCCSGVSSVGFAFDSPREAMDELVGLITPVETQRVAWDDAGGLVAAEDVLSDRPSPSCDVSAMDGYGLALDDCISGQIQVAGEVHIGEQPPTYQPGKALQIVTGAPVPDGVEVVIKREDVVESAGTIELSQATIDALEPGMNIRRLGENMERGASIRCAGRLITPPMVGMLTGFGIIQPTVYRPLRIGMITTGNEVVEPEQMPDQWQLRDSNSPTIRAMCQQHRWIASLTHVHVRDTLDAIVATAEGLMDEKSKESCDALVFTGGVSMGDHDHVPAAIEAIGARTVFHKLPQRPGKPVLGAVKDGKPIFGLPGNPVSVMVTAHRLLMPALAHRAGLREPVSRPRMMRIVNPDTKALGLWWSRLARVVGDEAVELIASKGSGDVPSSAMSDGFIEIPPNQSGEGPWAFWSW